MSYLLAAIFAYCWWQLRQQLRREVTARQLAESTRDKAVSDYHDIANSAMKGAPAVKWHRPYPIPANADSWYWLIRSENKKLLFTDEARKEAEQRARLLLVP